MQIAILNGVDKIFMDQPNELAHEDLKPKIRIQSMNWSNCLRSDNFNSIKTTLIEIIATYILCDSL